MSRLLAWVRSLRPDRGTLRGDAVAGVPGAIASLPRDGLGGARGHEPRVPALRDLRESGRSNLRRPGAQHAFDGGHHFHGRGSGGRLGLGSFWGADRPEALFVLSALAGVAPSVAHARPPARARGGDNRASGVFPQSGRRRTDGAEKRPGDIGDCATSRQTS
jgi:hypothetical protein